MDTAGEGSSKKVRNRQERGKKRSRKPKTTTPKTSAVPHLIQQLQEMMFPDPDTQVTKKEVLQQTKQYTLQLENTLSSLLKMKGHILMDDSSPCSLEDIKDEYLQLFRSSQGGPPAGPAGQELIDPVLLYLHPVIQKDLEESVEELRIEQANKASYSPDLIEFERYMHFYKETVDMLLENKVVPPGQVTHPVVSKAISNLWEELLRDGKTNIYQRRLSEARNTAACPLTYHSDAGYTDGGRRGSEAESQEASSSFLSTPEDVLIDDAFELAAGFLDCNSNQKLSNPGSPTHKSSPWESPEREQRLHQNISDFLRAKFLSCTQCDYDAAFLRCTETFDDEDDL
ncbi:stimulated by retinoic acid gene 8 protein homolog [Eleutherodactylus coqui]|uniref:stimulated by retinoic acid gene 8 protein homolog n=1 Tax=Eleutherodactylus coqui TaxID=57060 RepID=UPI003462BA63